MNTGLSHTSVDALSLAGRCHRAVLNLRRARDLVIIRGYNLWLTQPGLYGWLTRPLFPRWQGWYTLPEEPQNAEHPLVKKWLETYEPWAVQSFGVAEERHCERLQQLAETAMKLGAGKVGLTVNDLDLLIAAEDLVEDLVEDSTREEKGS